MLKKLHFCLLLAFVLSLPSSPDVSAQFFKAYYAKKDNFPNLSVRYLARTSMGLPYQGLDSTSFKVKVNGQEIPNANVRLNCRQTEVFMPVNIILLTDFTASMNESVGGGQLRKDWVLEATRKFIDSLKLGPNGHCNIVPFASNILSPSGFKNNKEELYFYLNHQLPPFQGLTNFNPIFFNPGNNVIELLSAMPDTIPRIVVMLTDGYHEQQTKFDHDLILQRLRSANIVLFTLALHPPYDADLKTLYDLFYISERSGGRAKELITKQELRQYFDLIAWEIQGMRSCRIEFAAPISICADEDPNIPVEIQLLKDQGFQSNFKFSLPPSAIKQIDISDKFIMLGKNLTEDKVTLSAKNDNFVVTNVSITPEGGDLNITIGPNPIMINKDSQREIPIRFVEKPDSEPTVYTVKFQSTPCETEEFFVLAPCRGKFIDMLEFEDTQENLTSELTIKSILTNNTPIEISGVIELIGTDAAEFKIVSGDGEFILAPDESLDLTIEFTPKSIGSKTAEIRFNTDKAEICGDVITQIKATGIINSIEDELLAKGIKIGNINPNPVNKVANLTISTNSFHQANIKLQDISGQVLYSISQQNLTGGDTRIELPTETIANGTYFVMIEVDGKTIARKFVVAR